MLYPSPSPMLSISFYSDLEATLSSACTFSEINKMESPLNLRSLAWLKRRCSKCFGALREAVRTDNSNWILILSIDANFKWRHFGRTHARSNLGSPPSFAEVPQDFVKQTEAEYNTLKKKSKRPTKALVLPISKLRLKEERQLEIGSIGLLSSLWSATTTSLSSSPI